MATPHRQCITMKSDYKHAIVLRTPSSSLYAVSSCPIGQCLSCLFPGLRFCCFEPVNQIFYSFDACTKILKNQDCSGSGSLSNHLDPKQVGSGPLSNPFWIKIRVFCWISLAKKISSKFFFTITFKFWVIF